MSWVLLVLLTMILPINHENSLFGEVKLTKNADIGKYQHSGYGIGFDRKSSFSFPGSGFGQNVIVLEQI